MAIWKPENGEILLARTTVTFSTGLADTVSGMRWYRDDHRDDIQSQLSGWPDGPTFTVRPKRERRFAHLAGKFAIGALYVVVVGILETLAGSGSAAPGGSGSRTSPQDPPNEVDDFPVMWATAESVARTLPWQLDPARCPENYCTHLIVTDRRILVVGFSNGDPNGDEVLWNIARSEISQVERMEFSSTGCDARIHFLDGSWVRLSPRNEAHHWTVLRHLTAQPQIFREAHMSSRQQKFVEKFRAAASRMGSGSEVVVTHRPSGRLLVEVGDSRNVDPDLGIVKRVQVMTKRGRRGARFPSDL